MSGICSAMVHLRRRTTFRAFATMKQPINRLTHKRINILIISLLFFSLTSCGVYSFRDVSIDYSKLKSIKIGFIENKARYINPQFSPKLTDKIQQKITNQTKLVRTNNDDASLDLSGYITTYDPSQTVGISNQQTATNRLTVTVHIILKNNVEDKTQEFDVTRNFDFAATLSLQEAEAQLLDKEVIPTITDEIFNKLFSNW